MAVQTPVASVEIFLEALEKSGLLSAEALAAARANPATDPKVLARDLLKNGTLTKWQANQLLHGFHLLTIGKFKLLDQLGAGEIGRVYLAEHAQFGRRHTLKVLAKRHMTNPEVVKKFLAEAAHACGLDHRNVSHIYDVSQEGDRCYVVMEYVEGEDLERLVRRSGKLDAALAVEFIRQAAEGLGHAHQNGVIHGDLKPSNLLLDASSTVKILDIGQSRLMATQPAAGIVDESQEMRSLAASSYHAPELRTAADRAAEVSSDVYSLGAVLCYLLTGKAVADAGEAAKDLAANGVAADLVALTSRLMADEPAKRPASMVEVLGEVASLSKTSLTAPKAKPEAKAKKPPVAKLLTESGAFPVARSLDEPRAEAEPALTGFAIQTKGKAGKKPPVKAVAMTPSPMAAETPSAAKTASKLPLIIAAAIGGGVLVMGGLAVVAYLAFGRGEKQIAKAPQPAAPAVAAATGEVNPVGPAGEANPTVVEANPTVAEANPTVEANPPVAVPANPPTSAPDAGSAAKTEPPLPMPESATPPTVEPAPPMPPATTEPKPMPPPKAKTPPAKTTPKAAPPKAKAEPNPLAGFAKTVALPPLPEAGAQPGTETLAPLTLGPCKVPADAGIAAHLKGAETAIRGGKQKFELQAKNAALPREWDVHLLGGEAPAVVATLAAKDGNLVFQWTEEGVKQAAVARQLGNCALDLAAGAGKHLVALRQPVNGPSLAVDFDKSGTLKWTVESLPDPKAIQIEVTKCDGLAKHNLEPGKATTIGEDLLLWTGPADDTKFLCLKLKPSSFARGLQVATQPQVKLQGKAEAYSKKKMTGLRQTAEGSLSGLTAQLNLVSKQKSKRKGDAIDIAKSKLQEDLTNAHKAVGAIDQLLAYVTAIQGTGKIQFRVYHQVEDAQVDLLITSD